MAIGPMDGRDLRNIGSATSSPRRKQNVSRESEQESREARQRVEDANRALRDTEVELSKRSAQLREEYNEQASVESARHEDSLESQRSKGYEQIRDLKRAQDIELARMKAEGERRVEALKNRYRQDLQRIERQGNQKLRELQSLQTGHYDAEYKTGESAMTELKETQSHRLNALQQQREWDLEQATQAYQKEFQRMQANSKNAVKGAEERFDNRYNETVANYDETLGRINNQASEWLEEVRDGHVAKLGRYEKRQEDPFYRMVDLGPDLEDTGSEFVLRVSVPEYEQENVKISFRGNDTLVLSGYRRNEDKRELQDGRSQRTAAFQSYSETLPLPSPVDAKHITREYDGGEIVVRIPKLGAYASKKIYQAPKPERARVERPNFPADLASGQTPGPGIAAGRKKSDRTLG